MSSPQKEHPLRKSCHIWISEIVISFDRKNCVNGIGTVLSEDTAHGKSSAVSSVYTNVIHGLYFVKNKFLDFKICNVNVETLWGKPGEIVEMLELK